MAATLRGKVSRQIKGGQGNCQIKGEKLADKLRGEANCQIKGGQFTAKLRGGGEVNWQIQGEVNRQIKGES